MPVLLELNDVLARKQFDRYVPIEKRKEFLAALVKQVEFVEITEEITDCRDPADNKFLELQIPLNLVEIDLEQSLELANRHKIYAYDAYIIACAVNQSCALPTLDGGLSYAAKAAGIEVMEVK